MTESNNEKHETSIRRRCPTSDHRSISGTNVPLPIPDASPTLNVEFLILREDDWGAPPFADKSSSAKFGMQRYAHAVGCVNYESVLLSARH